MDFAEKIKGWLIFFYLVLFPFGVLGQIPLSIKNIPQIRIYPSDIVVLLLLLILLFRKKTEVFSQKFLYFLPFLVILIFSFLINFQNLPGKYLLVSSLYLVRFVAYISIVVLAHDFVRKNSSNQELIVNSLTLVGIFVAIFGWVQYFLFPDLRPLFSFGWDEHYLRIFSTFLDPNFTSLVLVLTFILLVFKFYQLKSIRFRILVFLFITAVFFTIAFTYSRSGYLALIFALFGIWLTKNSLKTFVLGVLSFLILVFILPKGLPSEGVRLTRTASSHARLESWARTLKIASENPLFGVGFNNLSFYNVEKFNLNPSSHSVSGSENSILFVFSTTGILGLLTFAYAWLKILKENLRDDSSLNKSVAVSIVAIFIHSLFVNSLFYPPILGWVAILLGSLDNSRRISHV